MGAIKLPDLKTISGEHTLFSSSSCNHFISVSASFHDGAQTRTETQACFFVKVRITYSRQLKLQVVLQRPGSCSIFTLRLHQ